MLLSLFSGWLKLVSPLSCSYLLFVKRECFCSCLPKKRKKDEAINSSKGKLPMGADKVKKTDVTKKKKTHLEPAAVPCYTLHWKGCLALTEHVLRGDGQDLASSCSYRSLLALPLLLCFPLITTDKGHTGLCLHQWIERVVLTCLSLREWTQVKRGLKG